TDHAHIRLTDVRVPNSSVFGGEGKGLGVVQLFFNENRIRQGGPSRGAAEAVVEAAVADPGHPVPDRRARDTVRDAARARSSDGVDDGRARRVLGFEGGVDVQLLGPSALFG